MRVKTGTTAHQVIMCLLTRKMNADEIAFYCKTEKGYVRKVFSRLRMAGITVKCEGRKRWLEETEGLELYNSKRSICINYLMERPMEWVSLRELKEETNPKASDILRFAMQSRHYIEKNSIRQVDTHVFYRYNPSKE